MFKIGKTKLLPLLAAGILLVAGLGAAIPGAVTGDAPAVVQQAITISAAKSTLSGADTTGTASADGTSFLSPITVATGDSYTITLTLGNKSKVDAAAFMKVNLPPGFTLTGVTGATTNAQISTTTWLLKIGTSGATVVLSIRTDDTIAPGFYAINAILQQVEG